jgi:phage baseplate assembly protein V
MRELIERLVRGMVEPQLEKMEELSTEVEELRRRMQGMIRLGFVSKIHDSNNLIKVKHGDLETPFIRWFSSSAGETIDYRCPSLSEQCVLLNFASGNNGSQTVALIGLFSNQYPAPSVKANEILRVYPDGSKVLYDNDAHKLTIDVKGETEIKTSGKTVVNATQEVLVNGLKIRLNEGKNVVTTGHVCHFTGNPHGDGSSTVTAGQ